MSIAFMSLLAAIIGERIDAKAGVISLLPLLMLGAGSVIYWYWSEQTGTGDLRPYVLVQFYSGLAIALIALVFPSRHASSGELFIALIFYVLAKGFELLDSAAFNLGRIISGHTLKHLAAAVSAWCILRMIEGRVPKPSAASA